MEFIKKYKLIVFLAFLVVILSVVKFYFTRNYDYKSEDITTIEEKEEYGNMGDFIKETVTNNELDNKKNDKQEEEITTGAENEKDKILKELKAMDKEELDEFLETLTMDEILSLPIEDLDYCLENLLPYEGKTFVINEYLDASLLSVKAKGNDFQKSREDLDKWLIENSCGGDDPIIAWENE